VSGETGSNFRLFLVRQAWANVRLPTSLGTSCTLRVVNSWSSRCCRALARTVARDGRSMCGMGVVNTLVDVP